MQSLIFATSFLGFDYNDDERPSPGRNLVFCESDDDYWLEVPHHGRLENLERHIVVVDIAACVNIVPVLTDELTPIQGFELVLIHELVHASNGDEPYDKEHHTVNWNAVLIPLVQEYCTEFTNTSETEAPE